MIFSGEDESKEDGDSDASSSSGGKEGKNNGIQTLDSIQAMCLPLGASISLLVMFFFFDSMQMLFAICTAVIATVALAFLLLPMCQYLMRLIYQIAMNKLKARFIEKYIVEK